MKFSEAIENETTKTYTENGQLALNTTGNALLNLYGLAGGLRNADDERIKSLFAEAYKENPLLATKLVFHIRDVREGIGERDLARKMFKYMAEYHPESIKPNIELIGEYGRWDDLYTFVGTPVEDDMWEVMGTQLIVDIVRMNEGGSVSLLAKWIKTPDASSKNTRKLGILTAKKLGYSVYDFKRVLRKLRKHIDVTECKMSAKEWDKIEYSAVPSRAMKQYRNAFERHDSERFNEFIHAALNGEVKINAAAVTPKELIQDYIKKNVDWYGRFISTEGIDVLEAQWRQLPDYAGGKNILVMADVSGSMTCNNYAPLATSIGLALYFAERNTGEFHDMFMTFTSVPKFEKIKGETFAQKISNLDKADWSMSTDINSAMQKILDLAVKNNVKQEDMPEALLIVSDMEFDSCNNNDFAYNHFVALFEEHGYKMPNVIFWNVASRNNVFHVSHDQVGVQLASGESVATFKNVMNGLGKTPVDAMLEVLNGERYMPITVG